jgi:hypothetical protein
MAPRYALARLRGGPLDGELVQTPEDHSRMPASVIGLPVPVLDEQTETFWWDTANYFATPLPHRWHQGDAWPYAYARTLPGYPTYSKDVPDVSWVESP